MQVNDLVRIATPYKPECAWNGEQARILEIVPGQFHADGTPVMLAHVRMLRIGLSTEWLLSELQPVG